MKTFIWLIIVVLLTLIAKWEFVEAEEPSLAEIIQAIEQVESGGNTNAIGDNGNAVGCLQIWKIYVLDVNRISGRKFSFEDRLCKAKSYEMAQIYLENYASLKRLGHEPTAEDYARIHNGGPNGYKKACTLPYWNKVKSILN